ncbi:hypothetical protein FVA74_05950 [Salinibacterium sp. dk2585]|uniref:hypothetical protein n=1 Tax=unclassified Salinibacterium TaxID=2632331 RepID=UPI0011C255D4|nr:MULTISPECIES: hypothetical protein [unclassified Salinibacterium]QEE61168.1 hypothetical protein FVA74_05950 [Salinibacterium sp. dk2585]TXK53843.1 hypothetical protein FVP63_07400 [Salinibacterium sp. dk5596]
MPFIDSSSAAEEHVFAAYGRAMHGAQALEYWLRVLVQVHRVATKHFASHEELEPAFNTLSTSTMGTVFAALRSLTQNPPLEDKLTLAVAERNRLAHQFFGQWADIWTGIETEIRMIEDVDRVRILFEGTVQDLVSIIGDHLDTIGSNPDEYIPGLAQRISDVVGDGSLRI